MVHVGNTGISMSEIADTLRPGDVITHCYTPQKPSIIDEQGKLLPEVRKAKERGVIFDVGHAGGHFDFNLVRRAMGEGIVPDVISSDLHGRLSQPGFGVVGHLLTTLTKFLPLDMSFDEIIAKCTVDAARVVGWQDRIGTLGSRARGGHRGSANYRRADQAARLGGRRDDTQTTYRRQVDDPGRRDVSGQGIRDDFHLSSSSQLNRLID